MRINLKSLLGWRKWSMGMAGLLIAFVAALLGKLSAELAGVIGAIVSGFYAVNGYTTGKGGGIQPDSTGSTTENGNG